MKQNKTCYILHNASGLDVANLFELALSGLGYPSERIIRYTFLVEEALGLWRQKLPGEAKLSVVRRDKAGNVIFEFSVPGEKVDPFAQVSGDGQDDQDGEEYTYTMARMLDRLLSGIGSELKYRYRHGKNIIRLTLPKQNIEARIFRYNTLLLMIPIGLQCLFSNIASNIDTLMLGFQDASVMSGVSIASVYVMIPMVLIESAVYGETTLLAQYWGKRDRKGAGQVLSLSLMSALGIALLFSLVGLLAPDLIMGLYSDNEAIAAAAALYLRYVSLGLLITAVYLTLFGFLQCTGGARKALKYSVIGCLCNVGLNAVFIFGLFGIPALGVRGAALATVLSALIQAVLAAMELKKQGTVKLRINLHLTINTGAFAGCALTIGAQRLSWNVANNIITAAIGHMSADIVAANSALLILSGFVLSLKSGFGKGVGLQIGALLGKNRFEEAQQRAEDAQKYGALAALALVPVFISMGFLLRFMPMDFTDGTIRYMNLLLVIYAVSIFFNFMNALQNQGFLYAGGDSKTALIIDTAIMWGVMVPVSLISVNTSILPAELVLLILKWNEVFTFPLKFRQVQRFKWLKNLT